ncbi:1-acyl-sn-glycerol-3-phosphate acyltransferase alpha isoform X2 [Pogoniulus pusillus]|uniref:1-acyl-sn-glycerol-3-phosphate acyltransferase alpha isoform X2 n=1 Tax=Pogoniulus pusillus TaxID=488313 RepID=UPI0030B9508F
MTEVVLLQGLLLLLPLALLLYCYSASIQYFCKVAFFNCWIVTLATLLSPLAALRGRSVENMKLLRAALLPLKHIYGIKMQVRGSEQLDIKEPYVIVCNHQASLDLLGMVEVIPERCVPIAKKELLYLGTVGWACWLSGIIFIDRRRKADAIEVISRTARTMLRDNVPIFPMVISPYWEFFSSKEKRFTSGTCSIQILPRVETQGLTPADVPQLTEAVRQAMADVLAQMSAGHQHSAAAGTARGTGSLQCQEGTTRTSN